MSNEVLSIIVAIEFALLVLVIVWVTRGFKP